MIPGKIIAFLRNASIGTAGTRDKDLIPRFHKVSGWWVDEDATTMGCFIPEQFTRNLDSSLEDNGQFALTVTQIGSHETYQFKGEYVDHRPVGNGDTRVYEQCKHRFLEAIATYFPQIPRDAARDYYLPPAVAVRFRVREIFLQTPGPGAGNRLVPPENSHGTGEASR